MTRPHVSRLALAIVLLAAASARADDTPLRAQHLYNPIDRPIPIMIEPATGEASLHLQIIDAAALPVGDAVAVEPGTVNLAEVLPAAFQVRQASYLQLLVDGQPVGAPLVLQPMLSRLVPETEETVNPAGIRYTRIVGWFDEQNPPEADEADDAPPPGAEETEPVVEEPLEDQRLITGLRIYVDRDVVMRTTHGDLRFVMRPDQAPNTAWNFLELCEGGFYRGVVFHRVVPVTRNGDPFVIQAGDPTGTGNGGPGYWLPLERSRLPHDFGVISMARDVWPDSAGSQFFVCLSRAGTARLDGNYCAFGYAVEGAQAVLDIAAVELADVASGLPADPPAILATELVPAPPRSLFDGRPDRRVVVPSIDTAAPVPPDRVDR